MDEEIQQKLTRILESLQKLSMDNQQINTRLQQLEEKQQVNNHPEEIGEEGQDTEDKTADDYHSLRRILLLCSSKILTPVPLLVTVAMPLSALNFLLINDARQGSRKKITLLLVVNF